MDMFGNVYKVFDAVRVGFDIDGVLVDTHIQVSEEVQRVFKLKEVPVITSWDMKDSRLPKEVIDYMYKLLYDSAFLGGLVPDSELVEAVRHLCRKKEVHVVTSRKADSARETDTWLMKYYPGIKSLNMVRSKAPCVQSMALHAFVEDNPNYAAEIKFQVPMCAVYMPRISHNVGKNPRGVIVVKSTLEAVRLILGDK